MSHKNWLKVKNKYDSLFSGSETRKHMYSKAKPWKVLIADIDEELHLNVKLMFMKYKSYDNRVVDILQAYNYDEIIDILDNNDESFTTIIIDTSIGNEKQFLNTIRYIRTEYRDPYTRIILHGKNTHIDVDIDFLSEYDITDFRDGEVMAIQEIQMAVVNAISVYRDKKIKDVLFKEVHHRVKNNLQLILSILSLQSRYFSDEAIRTKMREGINRIRTISILHKQLYEDENISQVNFNEYTDALLRNVIHSSDSKPKNLQIETDVADLFMDIDSAIPCGIIINELVSNSVLHAFPSENEEANIFVGLYSLKSEYKLIISDNGKGLPEDISLDTAHSFGLSLVDTLLIQIEGKANIMREKGTSFIIKFPKVI